MALAPQESMVRRPLVLLAVFGAMLAAARGLGQAAGVPRAVRRQGSYYPTDHMGAAITDPNETDLFHERGFRDPLGEKVRRGVREVIRQPLEGYRLPMRPMAPTEGLRKLKPLSPFRPWESALRPRGFGFGFRSRATAIRGREFGRRNRGGVLTNLGASSRAQRSRLQRLLGGPSRFESSEGAFGRFRPLVGAR
jgi:hypothetical protein